MTITADDLDNLRHMLGAQLCYAKREWGFRNHYAPAGVDVESMKRLEAAGFVRQGRPYQMHHYYHATEAGCKAAGLNAAQTRRALEP